MSPTLPFWTTPLRSLIPSSSRSSPSSSPHVKMIWNGNSYMWGSLPKISLLGIQRRGKHLKISIDKSMVRFLICVIVRQFVKFLNAIIAYSNPKAHLYPLFSQGKPCNETTVTWTSGYNAMEVVPFVAWGLKGEPQSQSPAGRLTFS
ncbi:hypothetical protein CIPAW_05G209500 [Carya illinoinensis]|uniref:Uncharacterized protein n=1 Tax=Carya illinoinensis TaxID=32201 RepID=A0A8T1QM45_CARIL|nr:hypothetical protein CIPAW_05G209500 [Carya illinoinensis]